MPESFKPAGVTTKRLVDLVGAAEANPDHQFELTDKGARNLNRTALSAIRQSRLPYPGFDFTPASSPATRRSFMPLVWVGLVLVVLVAAGVVVYKGVRS